MKYKRIMVLAMLLVALLCLGAVNASENVTGDVTQGIDLHNDDVAVVDDLKMNDDEVISSSDDLQDNLSQNDNEDVLSYDSPTYSLYSVSVSDTIVSYGSDGTIMISVNPCTRIGYLKYNFDLLIIDSKGNEVFSHNYFSSSSTNPISYTFRFGTYSSGTYTIKLVNFEDGYVMDTAKLTIKSAPTNSPTYPSYSDYSVNVSDVTIDYGSRGSISMSITPSSKYYKYYYYLKVYSSSGIENISKLYYGTNSASYKTYSLAANELSSGVYTIKIVNYHDGEVMASARLTVRSSTYPSDSDYSVTLSNTTVTYGSGGSISMLISPASRTSYKYYYYFKVYDSTYNLKINSKYYDTSYDYSKTYTLSSTKLNPGNYTMEIINYFDNVVMSTAKLTVQPSSPAYSDYDVSVSDTTIKYGTSGSISMKITSANAFNYKYNYYLKVYDSNNTEKISTLYSGTTAASSKTYRIGSNQLSPGLYTIKIINAKDNQVMSTAKLNIRQINLETQDITVKCDGMILYKVRANENGIYKSGLAITFNVNGEEYGATTDDNGYATLKIHLPAGTYDITTQCGDVSKRNTIKVNKVYVANKYKAAYVKQLSTYYKSSGKIKYGWKGNLEGYFKIYKANKVIYQTKFNTNGYINDYFKYAAHNKYYPVSAIKNAGSYRAVMTDKNGKVLAKSTIKISKNPTHIKCSSFVMKIGTKKSIKVYVYDKSNSRKNIAGTVKLKINGKTYAVKVKNGVAVIKNLKFPSKVKTYVGNIKFLGNSNYGASSKNIKVAVRKLASEIDVSSITVLNGAKASIVAKVYVIDLSGDYIRPKSGTVKFTVAGGTYYAKINNGVAKLRITAPYSTGTYSCKAVYMGSSSIAGSSSSFKMAVKKPSYSVVIGLNVNSGLYSKAKLKTGDILLGVANSYTRQHSKGITIGTMIDAGQEFQHSTRLIKATVWYENDYTGRVITRTNPSVYNGYNIKVFDWIDGYTPYQAEIWYTYR